MSNVRRARQLLIALAVISLQPALLAGSSAAAGVGSAPVRVVNPATDPVLTREVDRPANRAFAKLLCLADIPDVCNAFGARPALPSSFTVPTTTAGGETVKRLVIEFVSGTCTGLGRSTFVELSSRPGAGSQTNPDTGDNFTSNRFPLAVAQFLQAPGINGAAAFAQTVRLYFDPGAVVSMSFDIVASGGLACRAQMNGHFVVH